RDLLEALELALRDDAREDVDPGPELLPVGGERARRRAVAHVVLLDDGDPERRVADGEVVGRGRPDHARAHDGDVDFFPGGHGQGILTRTACLRGPEADELAVTALLSGVQDEEDLL